MSKKWHVVSNSCRFKDQVKSSQVSVNPKSKQIILEAREKSKAKTNLLNSLATHIKMPSSTEDSATYITVDVSDAGKPVPGQSHPAPASGAFPVIDRSDLNLPAPRPSNVVIVDVSDAGKPAST
jgi:hypothetical protein